MKILVAYASRHGATRGIAERVAQTLEHSGHAVTLSRVESAGDVRGYDAFVIGSAAYYFRWLKEATTFVQRNRSFLASRPAWLFSSGPVGPDAVDAQGRDQLETAVPKEFAEFASSIHPRDQRVFFGAWDPDARPTGVAERLTMMIPGIRKALPIGDFRDWPAIESWAAGIAQELQSTAGLATTPRA